MDWDSSSRPEIDILEEHDSIDHANEARQYESSPRPTSTGGFRLDHARR
jgi:hypothetical protein